MTLDLPSHISRSYVQQHPEIIFLHGFDVLGKGFFGQASIHNEPNSFPIPVLFKYCPSGRVSFTDIEENHYWHYIQQALNVIPKDGRNIVYLRRIGTGCSRMSMTAPRMYIRLLNELDNICTKVNWIYR